MKEKKLKKSAYFISILLNVGCIIFMVLVYPEIVMESCLTYEKKVNDCRKFYELRIFYSFFFRVCYNAVRIIDRNCNCIYSGGN